MELRHLRYFIAIAEERSFTGAAERLWVAQPGLSTQMRRLEAELGVQLFERHSRGVDLTQAGALFLERARAAASAADLALATGRDLEAGLIGSVRLGLAAGARWHLASELLLRFGRERPGVELTAVEAYGRTLWRDLRAGRLDALVAPTGHGSADLRTLELGHEDWVVLVGTGHPLAGIGAVDAEDLQGEPITITGHRDGAVLDRAVSDLLAELGVAAQLVPGAPGPARYAAVANNEAVVLTTAPDAVPPGVIVRRLEPRRTLAFELLWRDELTSPALSELISLAAANVRRPSSTRALAAVA
ncbi:MAG TPA: LysR family transcriptional regulator [Solirubrobacteraceae bacterium]|nr:LysR family transcriptional regulator [Solirubrobacteraceae bacterium]